MIYYLTDVKLDCSELKKRNAVFSEAGTKRSLYIIDTFQEVVEVISLAVPTKKGLFRNAIVQDAKGNSFYYPASLNYFKLKHLTILLSIACRLIRHLKSGDVVVVYNANIMHVLPLLLCKLIKNVRVIYQIEELYSKSSVLKGIRSRIMAWTERTMLRASDAFIIVCDTMKEYISEEKPVLLNFGYFITNKLNHAETEEKVVVYSGRLDYEGGIELFIESLEYVDHEVRAIVTGSGPLEDKIRKTIIMNSLVTFEFLSFVDEDLLAAVLNNASVCVNPLRLNAKFARHSFPSKVLAYLSYGNTVVTSRTPGVLPLLDQFDNIYTYSFDCPKEIAKQINIALSQKVNRERNVAKTKMFFEKQTSELIEFWSSVLSSEY